MNDSESDTSRRVFGSDSNESSSDESSASNSSSKDSVEDCMDKLILEESNSVIETQAIEITSDISTKGSNKDYEHSKIYSNLVAAKTGISNKEIGDQYWTRGDSYSTKLSDKICYTCSGFPKCSKRMNLLLDPETQDVHVYISSDEHNHESTSRFINSRLNHTSRAKVNFLL